MDRVERYTYHLHVQAAIPEGIFMGLMWSAGDVAAKNMGAQALAITFITMAPAVSMLLSLFIAGRLSEIDRRSLLLVSAVIGRLPMVLMIFIDNVWGFLVLLVFQSIAMVPITAAQNATFRSNYRRQLRGTLFGKAQRYSAMVSGAVVLLCGIYLDRNPQGYRVMYPITALMGVLSCWLFARIRVRPGRYAVVNAPRMDTISTLRDVLVRDRAFLRYELGFFLYGIAFMAITTAKPLFAANVLKLDNAPMLGARALFSVMTVFCTPFMGRLMDRVGPARLAMGSFMLLSVYAFLLFMCRDAAGYFLAEGVFGIAMSGVLIAWNIGPVTLAREGEAIRYMGVHVALVGVRGLIGHPLGGVLVGTENGHSRVFLLGLVAFLAGSVVMYRLGRDLHGKSATSEDSPR